MIEAKPNFVDRVEQSIVHLKNNLLPIVLPITLCNIFFLAILPALITQLIPFEEMMSWDISQKMSIFISLWLALWWLYILTYLFVLIPVQIAMIKTIQQTFIGEKVKVDQYLWYGFKTIGSIFKTYWYSFEYVALIPALIFILWWIALIVWLFMDLSPLDIIWWIIMWASCILFLVFSIYRWTKANFAIISAIDNQEFTKENFTSSVSLSDNGFWRVFWNLFGIGFIVGCVINLINFITSLTLGFTSYSSTSFEELSWASEIAQIQDAINWLADFNLPSFIVNIISTWVWSALGTLIVVFTYLLFKRLQVENNIPTEKTKIPKKVINKIKEL